ncbi:MAG: hypothetical protein WAX14_19635 [Rhodococcus sp. (in: high G+C Gram-positive bacteria)]|uniref:hypothetical protein n=1 Tax=Rhodococcus sp. TaxID=1831 RepID=UPI003BB7912E
MRATTRYLPDLAALSEASERIVIGIGAESGNLITSATATALADAIAVSPVEFPGEHTGFVDRTEKFANRLHGFLT